MIRVFLIGLVVGVICVGGLAIGVRWLFKSRDETLDEGSQTKYGIWGALTIVGQFVVAGLILYFAEGVNDHPLALATGLLSMNLLLPAIFGWIFYRNRPNPPTKNPDNENDPPSPPA
ncbi:hypothetical protein GW916_15210 [bacterium]|nr:hypothetical protein [bacterium]